MKRKQAVAIVKELVSSNLIESNWLSIEQKKTDNYELMFRGEYQHKALNNFLGHHKLAMAENREKKIVVIFEP